MTQLLAPQANIFFTPEPAGTAAFAAIGLLLMGRRVSRKIEDGLPLIERH